MQVLACNAPQLRMMVKSGVSTSTHLLGRRELCFDGVSSVCSSSQPSTSNPSTSESSSIRRLFFSPFYSVLLHRLIKILVHLLPIDIHLGVLALSFIVGCWFWSLCEVCN